MKYTGRFLIPWVSTLLLLPGPAWSQVPHIAHCLGACPDGAPAGNEIVVRHLFAGSVNGRSGIADWIAYRVLKESVGVASLLPRWWRQDKLLSTTAAAPDPAAEPTIRQPDLANAQDRDYRLNEIIVDSADSGRLVPLSSFAGTPYWSDLNYLSNMAPLPAGLRLGSWSRLDQAINELAAGEQELWVVSGPVYEIPPSPSSAPDVGNTLPAAYFKVVATGDEAAAFIFSATLAPHARHCEQSNSLAEVESRTGLRLFPATAVSDSGRLRRGLRCDGSTP